MRTVCMMEEFVIGTSRVIQEQRKIRVRLLRTLNILPSSKKPLQSLEQGSPVTEM